MGSAEGALKTAAARTGHSVTEYLDRMNAGLRWCYQDQAWEPADDFGKDSSRIDGLGRSCRRSVNARARAAYDPKPRPASGRRFVEPRDDDRKQARRRVNYLVGAGLLPHPNALPCTDCGRTWLDGAPRHEYDHYLGYAQDHHEDVEAVCSRCHHAREGGRHDG
jgi:hypothetical protein